MRGHRERMRQRFAESDGEGFAPHEMLELMLFNTVPRANTNPISHALLQHFGTLDAVVNAPCEQLTQVPGVGEESAHFLRLLGDASRLYLDESSRDRQKLFAPSDTRAHVLQLYRQQLFRGNCCIALDAQYNQVSALPIDGAVPDVAGLSARIYALNANSVIIVYDMRGREGKQLVPSKSAASQLETALAELGIPVFDYWAIVEYKNELRADNLQEYKINASMYRKQRKERS